MIVALFNPKKSILFALSSTFGVKAQWWPFCALLKIPSKLALNSLKILLCAIYSQPFLPWLLGGTSVFKSGQYFGHSTFPKKLIFWASQGMPKHSYIGILSWRKNFSLVSLKFGNYQKSNNIFYQYLSGGKTCTEWSGNCLISDWGALEHYTKLFDKSLQWSPARFDAISKTGGGHSNYWGKFLKFGMSIKT